MIKYLLLGIALMIIVAAGFVGSGSHHNTAHAQTTTTTPAPTRATPSGAPATGRAM